MPEKDLVQLKDVELIVSPVISLLPYHLAIPYVVTIHDFQHKYYPQFFSLREKILREMVYKSGKKALFVVCESDYVKKDVAYYLNLKEENIKVILSPPPKQFQQYEIESSQKEALKVKYNLPDKYVFFPAQFWPHKNHLKLLLAMALIRNKYNVDIPLVFVGAKKNNYAKTLKEIVRLGLINQVEYLGYIPDEDMPGLYKLSVALVMPTLFESVSLPIWEAFSLGVPVISSNVCALPEQVGSAGLLFDPNNVEDIAEKIYIVWKDDCLKMELIKKGYEKIKKITFESYAKKWEEIFDEYALKYNLTK